MREEKISLRSLGDPISCFLFLPDGPGPFPVLLISHGAGDYHGNYREISEFLTGQNIATFVPDMHGHGESGGERFYIKMKEWVPDLQACINYLVTDTRIDRDKICAFGLSSGGTAIFETALVDHRLRALIALDATVRTSLPFIFDVILRLCILIGTIKKMFTGKDLRYPLGKIAGTIHLASDPEVDLRVRQDPACLGPSMAFPFPGAKEAFYIDTIKRVHAITAPTLVIWGEEDQLDTPATAHFLFAALRCKKDLQIIPGNGHVGHLDTNRQRVFELTANWIRDNTNTPLGSPRLIEGEAAKRFTREEKERHLLPFVQHHGTQALSYATLQDNLEYFITDKGFIAYTKAFHPVLARKGRYIALEDPLCAPENRLALAQEFLAWHPEACFFIISEDFAAQLRPLKFKVNCVGPEPELPVQSYNTQGNWKDLDLIKRARNEAKRKGVTIREVAIETVPLEQLRKISRVWMQTKILQTREIWIYARPPVFASEPDVRKFVAFDSAGEVVGFVFYDPIYRDGKVIGYAANTVRCDETNYGKIATAIHMEAIEVFRKEGIETLNLCLAPFVKMDEGKFNDDAFCKSYFKLCERYGNDIYNFRGLAFHKSKYRGTEKFIYIASNNFFPANDVYLAYQTAGIAVSYFRSTTDLLKGIVKGIWRETFGKPKAQLQTAPTPEPPVSNLKPNLSLLLFLLLLAPLHADTPAAGTAPPNATSAPAPATPPAPPQDWLTSLATQDYLFGDWGGERTNLSKQGVDFEFDYFSALPTDLDGGLATGTVYEGGLLATADLDFEKLAGLHGSQFHVSSLFIHGQAFSSGQVGDVNQVSLLDLTHSLRLWQMWYEQKLWDDKVTLKAGQLSVDGDFIVPELYGNLGSINFLNQTFFYPTMAFNVFERPFLPNEHHGLASTPFTSPGAVVRVDATPHLYAQAGVYGGNPDRSYHGTNIFDFDAQTGTLSYYEVAYRPNMAQGDKGLPGSYKLGAYYQTGTFSDNDSLQALFGLPSSGAVYHDNYGLYFLGEQTLYRAAGPDDPAQKGLVGFVRGGYAPPDRNLYEWGADGGLVYRGLIPGRDYDTCGVAVSYLGVSDEFRNVERTIDNAVPGALPVGDYEGVIEGDYKVQLTAWMTVQASLQRVIHPGAQLAVKTPDATVLILQTGIRF